MKWVDPPDIDCITEPVTAVPPLPIQGSLFGGMPKVLEMMPELERFATRPPRIRRVQKTLGLDAKKAKRIYMQAERYYEHQQAYDRYCHCKEYLDWRYSPVGQDTIRQWVAERDHLYAENLRETSLHIVEIAGIDAEVARLLDVGGWERAAYHGPMKSLVESLNLLTLHDAKILLKRGYLRVIDGDVETLLASYNYPAEALQPNLAPPLRCIGCGRALHYNAVGVNRKLGANAEKDYRCLDCLGINDEQAKSMVEMYRGEGCPLFV